jgi:flagellin-like hook-associated protein FlgL
LVESQASTNSQSEIQKLQTELKSVKNKLNNLSDTSQKSRLENKLSNIENQTKNLSSSDNSTIKKLEQEIEGIKQQIEKNDAPNEDPQPNNNKKEAKVKFVGKSLKEMGGDDYDNYKFVAVEGSKERVSRIFYISKNHSRIKELLKENKLQKDKQFTLRYGKIDKKACEAEHLITFNENNRELEISEGWKNDSKKIELKVYWNGASSPLIIEGYDDH